MSSPFRSECLKGRVALVTGGGSGIGLEIARQLGQHGAAVVIMGRRREFLEKAAGSLMDDGVQRVSFYAGDVRKEEDAAEVVRIANEKYGGLSIVVNSAAGNYLATAESLTPKGFRTVMEIDAIGTFTICKAALASLKSSGGVIINISATLQYGATWYQIHASAAKSAIDSMTRSMALEWGRYGIRVNGIAPGPIADTAGMTKLAPGADTSMMESMIGATIPLGRMGKKWDIAMCCVFLCSEAGGYISGDTIVVDGAAWMWRQPALDPEDVERMSRGIERKSRSVGGAQSKL